jgi:FMN reductase
VSSTGAVSTIVLVLGAVSPPGRLHAAFTTLAGELDRKHTDVTVSLLDLRERRPEACDGRSIGEYDLETQEIVRELEDCAGVVFFAPVYRASYPGILKNLLDLLPVSALRGKAIGIVAMGASDHHFLAVDWQLRLVLGWFGAIVAPTSVYLTSRDFEDGALADEGRLAEAVELGDTVIQIAARLADAELGPTPLAAKYRGQ